MRIQRSAAVAATLALAALPILASGIAAGGHSATSAERAEHARIVAYWTPARVRAAIPRDFAFDTARGYHIVPNAKPGAGGGGITGASWPNGTGKVYRATGKVLFTMGTSQYVCSGTSLSNSRGGTDGVVLTAGHCAYDETARRFATNWLFVPQFDSNPTFTCGSTAYGCWTAKALVVNNGFASAGGFNNQATQYDWAFAVVGGGGKTAARTSTSIPRSGTSATRPARCSRPRSPRRSATRRPRSITAATSSTARARRPATATPARTTTSSPAG
jgi:hypothetical protein